MPGYHERLRDLDGTRYLLRDFSVYGCRTRSELPSSLTRTYDNERRRIEALLGDTLVWQYGRGGKQFFLSADASRLACNPLHRMYRLHSFTDNDMILHFFLLDALNDGQERDAASLTDMICDASGIIFDEMTVRRKLNAYVKLGMLRSGKQGKRLLYSINHPTIAEALPDKTKAACWLSFFREAMPFGCVADEMMMREGLWNDFIRFKHHFLIYTLDDAVCIRVLEAMHARLIITCRMDAQKKNSPSYTVILLPVLIRISEQTGRRYVIGWDMDRQCVRSYRMDLMHEVVAETSPENAGELTERTLSAISKVWGVSCDSCQTEHLSMIIHIDPETEAFVLDRLHREKRGGSVTALSRELYRFDIDVLDTNELMNWVKTFTGRIVSLKGDNQQVGARFYEDMRRMNEMYGGDDDGTV